MPFSSTAILVGMACTGSCGRAASNVVIGRAEASLINSGGSLKVSSVPELSIVVPMYNEADSCAVFFSTVVPVLEACVASYEIICVDDGSADATLEVLRRHRAANPAIKIVGLSRNFGKEAAMTAGIDLARGRAVVPIDADLQDPPELLKQMVAAWKGGAQVVLARRSDRKTDGPVKRLTSNLFYVIFGRMARPAIPRDVGDFRLMDRMVVDALKRLPERSRFMKGLFAWVGYRQVTLDYVRAPRAAGKTKFNYWKLWNFALDGLVSFSTMPLKVWSYFGIVISLLAGFYMSFLIIRTILTGVDTPGYASLMTVILFFNGLILISLGALGEYIGRIFTEVKQRPIYLLSEVVGLDEPAMEIDSTSVSLRRPAQLVGDQSR
jgi:glycosyltransferase involved in cell wall biosynthesis